MVRNTGNKWYPRSMIEFEVWKFGHKNHFFCATKIICGEMDITTDHIDYVIVFVTELGYSSLA